VLPRPSDERAHQNGNQQDAEAQREFERTEAGAIGAPELSEDVIGIYVSGGFGRRGSGAKTRTRRRRLGAHSAACYSEDMAVAPPRPRSVPPLPELAVTLTVLPELGLRLGWLHDYTTRMRPAQVAFAVDALATAALSGDTKSREALLAVAVFLAVAHERPLISELREAASARSLLGLDRLVRARHDEGDGFELELPVPRYGERELTLGERRSLARRPTRLVLEKLLLDPDPLVIEQLLKSPSLTEVDVLSLATHRSRGKSAFAALVAAPRWITRPRLRHAIVQNPRTPHGIALPLVSTLLREDLLTVQRTTTVSPVLRVVATELLERLPPLYDDGDGAECERRH
jgi:hypothetical protein